MPRPKPTAQQSPTERYLRRQLRQALQARDSLAKLTEKLSAERAAMAMLAADTPQFDNPLLVYEAKKIRDHVLESPSQVPCALRYLGTLLDASINRTRAPGS